MSTRIQLLPDHVANQIAAGEVVQRPASAVKELLENAVDAGANLIQLHVKDGGRTLIQVIDNGSGMSPEDARLCFARHATSKIRKAEDLFDLVTKGFRGEALASIASVAQVELSTRRAEDELGTKITIEGSQIKSEEPAVLPVGSSFSIKNLFFNIPARRNFLKSETAEFRHIVDEFQRVALAHPQIQFLLHHNGSELFHLPASNLRQRIVAMFGGKTNEKLVPIAESTELVELLGFVGKPEFAKKNRSEQFFFVNDRFVKSGYLHHAVMAAYEGLLKDGMQPSYFLFLQVAPHTIDINIHPTKTEIKFDDEQALYAIMRAAVKHSLGQFNVAPILDFERDASLDTPYTMAVSSQVILPGVEVDPAFNPFASESNEPNVQAAEQEVISSAFSASHFSAKTYRADSYTSPTAYSASSAPVSFSSKTSLFAPKQETSSWDSLYTDREVVSDFLTSSSLEFVDAPDEETIAPSLFNDSQEKLNTIKTFQLHKKYIVNLIKSGMLIVDQQRAHQRILYEQFLLNLTQFQANSQQLLFPAQLYFGPQEMLILRDMEPALVQTGFVFENWNADCVFVSGIPVTMNESEISIVLEQLMHDFQEGYANSFSISETIAKSLARSMAVKTGISLSELEQENIIHNLFACNESQISPFGKPTYITMQVEDIDKKFTL